MRAVFAEMSHQYQIRFIGDTVEVLWESGEKLGNDKWLMKGLTGNYLRIATYSNKNLANQIQKVKIMNFSKYGLEGLPIQKDRHC